MRLIKEIYEKDLDLGNIKPDFIKTKVREQAGEKCYRLRKAARALIFHENKIAILKAVKLNLHKLPGGGIDKTESIIQGLHREVLEETGCKIDNIHDHGIIIEYRDTIEMAQISYVFTCNVYGTAGVPIFTQKEQDEGFQLLWLKVPEVIKIMKDEDKPNTYSGRFIYARDLAILQYYAGFKM